MFYADAALEPGAKLSVPAEHAERAVYILEGSVKLTSENETYHPGQLLVLKPSEEIVLTTSAAAGAPEKARVLLLGGEPLGEKRFIWWNFVSSSAERIEQAKEDWKEGKFAPVPDETERIPLPRDSRPVVARYP